MFERVIYWFYLYTIFSIRLNVYCCTLCICSQNRSACCEKAAVQGCPPPEAGAGFGQSTDKEVKGWGTSQRLGLLEKEVEVVYVKPT